MSFSMLIDPSHPMGALIIGIVAGLISGIIIGFFSGKEVERKKILKAKASIYGKGNNIILQNSDINSQLRK